MSNLSGPAVSDGVVDQHLVVADGCARRGRHADTDLRGDTALSRAVMEALTPEAATPADVLTSTPVERSRSDPDHDIGGTRATPFTRSPVE
jgi:hypothetical protein